MTKFKTTSLTSEEDKIVAEHLEFINYISAQSLKHSIRTIIGGGYAVDGKIGKITRFHNDVDIQLYGKHVMNPVLLRELLFQEKFMDIEIDDTGRKEYYNTYFLPEIGVEIYYIQLATNPFADTHIILKSDGKFAEEQEFRSQMVYLNGTRFEAQDANIELADKIFKREYRGDPRQEKHEQDIFNLRLITNNDEVDAEVQKRIKRLGR